MFAARRGSARRPTSIGKKKYDGLLPTEMRRLKQLEDENSKLKRIVADLSLDKEMLQDAIRRKL
jgi:putative transposase